jgi:hypothetical protein
MIIGLIAALAIVIGVGKYRQHQRYAAELARATFVRDSTRRADERRRSQVAESLRIAAAREAATRPVQVTLLPHDDRAVRGDTTQIYQEHNDSTFHKLIDSLKKRPPTPPSDR